jgi:D-lactate dehydrogenase
MRVAMFDVHRYDRASFEAQNQQFGHELVYFEPRLTPLTAPLAQGFACVCSFVNDQLNETTLRTLHAGGVRHIALRCAGYNHVDLDTAKALGLIVTRVPEYSPYAVAEHAVALLLALNRKLHRAHNRIRDNNFSLDGLVGFDLHGRTVGVVGTGKIGAAFARIMRGFGCRLLGYDVHQQATLAAELQLSYVGLDELLSQSDVVSLHVPLMPQTHYLINAERLNRMKRGAVLINTSRGGLVDTRALIEALKHGQLGGAGLDVYEEEEGIFFEDLGEQILQDDVLARLLTFPNVLITSHQAFLTAEALANIAHSTLASIRAVEANGDYSHTRVC